MTLFAAWAPESARWSAWAKPVLFTYVDAPEPSVPRPAAGGALMPPAPVPAPPADVPPTIPVPELLDAHVPPLTRRAAIVVDMPGAQGIACGLALARHGYRPVPLYNATCGPGMDVIDLTPIIGVLRLAAAELESLRLRDDAPPAFLIDSRRLDGVPSPSMWDNRWMVFPQDFPSARALRARDIDSVVVIRRSEQSMKQDFRHVLRAWKREDMHATALDPATGVSTALDFDTSLFAVFGDQVTAFFTGLRRNYAGGFGGAVPVPQATSGGYM
jgi:hypothetical protein